MAALARTPEVSVPTSHGDHAAGVKKPRTNNQPVLCCTPKTPIPAPDVANGSKSTRQRVPQHAHRMGGAICIACGVHPPNIHIASICMNVEVYKARHQRAASNINNVRISSNRFVRYLADQAVLNKDMRTVQKLSAHAIKNARITKYQT
jgi:hypothetical protein